MKKGWEVKSLGEVCENLDSKRVPITKSKRVSGDIPYYGASGIVDHVADYIFDERLLLVSEDGANLLARTYPIAFSIEGKTWVNNHAHVLKFVNLTTQHFIEYFLNSIKLDRYISGMAQPKLNQKSLNSIIVPIPPLEEQKQIVAILDDAFAAIEQAQAIIEKNIDNAKELFQSKLNDIFSQKGEGWEEKSLGDICENLDSKRKPITKNKRISGDIPYYGASGIVDHVADYLFDEDLLLVSEDGANLLARTYPIAFSISGKNWVNNHAHVLRFKNISSQYFVEYYLNSIKLNDYVSGMAQPKLNQRNLNSIKVPFPNLETQEKIVGKLNRLIDCNRELVAIYQQKLTNLEDLKKSLLEQAFAGELTHKDMPA
ncbi:restriction endonuclease subunit S [Psychrobacter sp. HII-4]|uniref:restriction endonuclease subunit S n=1 Tax=Psychrobacter sp. HII-4 TaxID=1569264 RepID=UPI00191B373F|nr:restriction endonuclease subunit S [Psychrobacter sp. HII-4]